MLTEAALTRLLELHACAFGIVRWINQGRRYGPGSWRAEELREVLASAESCEAWLRRQRAGLPGFATVIDDELPVLASLLVSFLRVSYEIAADGSYPLLRRVMPGSHAAQHAEELRMYALRRLADELELPLVDAELREVRDGDAREAIILMTYARELERRSEYMGQGQGVAWLWRQMAWKPDGGMRSDFELTATLVIEAQSKVVASLRAAAGAEA